MSLSMFQQLVSRHNVGFHLNYALNVVTRWVLENHDGTSFIIRKIFVISSNYNIHSKCFSVALTIIYLKVSTLKTGKASVYHNSLYLIVYKYWYEQIYSNPSVCKLNISPKDFSFIEHRLKAWNCGKPLAYQQQNVLFHQLPQNTTDILIIVQI